MMNEAGFRRMLPEQSSGSVHTVGTLRHPSVINPILSKRVCFYKSGDPQFSGLRLVINNRTFKTFDALLDSLSKKVPLPFGVRNITTPRGIHAINTLDELEDGKSYICSDSRKVKPINLALARKKLPPWYHARPVSSRRRTVQQARLFPGRNIHKPEPVVVRTPKRLLVFRNGEPSVKHTVVLHKKTTPSYESILEYISELMQYHVVKLYTPDGKRVDGLPGLILCSGTVVAVGREPFRPAVYSAQKSSASTRLHTNRMSLRRQKALNRKKKSLSYSSKSRNFSPSSERYIVHQIHNTIAGSLYGSNPTNSVELESSRILESVAETEGETCLGDGVEGADGLVPGEDDIEKSFRVNQDGSMTVEMKVRLTLKEEETIHWTTTLSRSAVANQLNETCLPEPDAEQEICSLESLDLKSPTEPIDVINRNKDNNYEDPPSLSNGPFSETGNEEDDIKSHTDVPFPMRTPTPVYKQITKKQSSVESIKSVTADGIQEGMVGAYSYREQTENGTMTEQYCMVKQSSTRPVPKPRRLGSVDANSRNISAFKSAGMGEMLQIESSGEEVTETVLHIYEQQTCQDNFFANVCAHGMSASGVTFGRPATSETGQLSSNNEFEPELWRPSTASESISIWRTESMSVPSDLNQPVFKTGANEATNRQQPSQKLTKGKVKAPQRELSKDKRVSPKPKVFNRHVRRVMTPGKRQKGNSPDSTESHKKVNAFSSAGFLKRIYGNKSKSPKSKKKLKKRPIQNGGGGAATKTSQPADNMRKGTVEDLNIPSAPGENTSENVSFVFPTEVSQPRGILTRQASMHTEKKHENESYDISESMSLPAINSSSSVTNEYVENWLEKAHFSPQRENGRCGESENKHGLIIVAEKVKCLEETSEIQTCQTSEPLPPPPESLLETSVKLRVQSFENKSPSPSVEKTTVTQQIVQNHNLSQKNAEEIKPLLNGSEIIPAANDTLTESPLGGEVQNKSNLVKISFQKATPSNTLSMELPPPPPPETTELSNTEYCMNDVSSVASSPLYKLSSVSSERTDNHPLSTSPTSDKDISPTENTKETIASVQTDIPDTLKEASLSRGPSVKRAPLVSNVSLERKMSLRKACLDKYTLSSDATSDVIALSTPVDTVGDDVLPNGICSTGTQQPIKVPPQKTQQSILGVVSSPSCCTSVSPTSLTSDERMSSVSISSSEASVQSSVHFKDGKMTKTQVPTQKEASSPKVLVKKVKPMSSPSPERKFQHKKLSFELPNNQLSPNIGKRTTPNSERKQKLYKPKQQKRPSPYSQSLDMVSSPVRHKSKGNLSRNLSSDNQSEPTNTQRKTRSQGKRHQTVKSTTESEKMLISGTLMNQEADQIDENKVEIQEKSTTRPLNTANQPNMKPVLEKICYSIKSIRQITQNKRPSCLEKSNSLPDFSSHVASTFGSSSKALLAFLSVMTLKEGITNLNMDELNANNVSCAEALKMIDSLREIASIEDSHMLKASLSDLQQSASEQLLHSWRGFQELSDKCKSRSATPNSSEQKFVTEAGLEQDCSIDETVIDEIMGSLDVPDELKEELASLSAGSRCESVGEVKIIERLEMSSKEISDEKTTYSAIKDPVIARDVTQDDNTVDVRSMIKKFTDQTKQSGTDLVIEPAKHKPTGQATKNNGSQNNVTKYQMTEPKPKQSPEERQLHSTTSLVQENGEDLELCPAPQENQEEQKHQRSHNEHQSTQERLNMNGDVSEQKTLETESCRVKTKQEENMTLSEFLTEFIDDDDKSGSDEEGQNTSSANEDVAQNESSGFSSSEAGGQQSSEEEPEAACEEIKQESSEGEDSSNHESSSEEDMQPSSNYYVELNVRGKESISCPDSENVSEEEQPEVEHKDDDDSSTPACLSKSGKEQQSETCSTGLTVSVNESTGNSDVDETASEEHPEAESKKLQVIVEESLSAIEEEQEEEIHDFPGDVGQIKKSNKLEALIEETEEDRVSSEDEDLPTDTTEICDNPESQNSAGKEKPESYTIKDESSLIKTDSLERHHRFNTDDDSGNDHSSCEEHTDEEQPKLEVEQISTSIEEELSFYEKESTSEEEQINVNRNIEESRTQYQHSPVMICENAAEDLKHQAEEAISQSVAERVFLLEKQVADAQTRNSTTKSSAVRRFSQRNALLESDEEDSPSESPTSNFCTRSAPQSSLSFSYDSSAVITTEPEGSRVRCIREMFLAKSATDIQQRHIPSSNTSELLEIRPETSVSGGYQSQTSSELSSGEDDSARKTISKGFVRRTIERLYGKKDGNQNEGAVERPPSGQKQKKKEHSSIFSPFHTARSKAMSELSYFNSTNALDTLTEATRCIAFNAQVGPGDSVPIDNGRWLLRENTLMRKSVSDPVAINKSFTDTQGEEICEDTEQNTPYSLFSTQPELEDKAKSLSRKCIYFSLPHADSDGCQDDQSTASKGSANGDSVVEAKDNSEDTKTWAERNGMLPSVSDFKMMDNKVHPLVELPADGEAVVVQPGKGHGIVNRRIQDPDMLDFLYTFCGQHCPIL